MKHELPRLPYAYDALEPHMDERTVTIHHDKHHQAYVDNLNKALEPYPELQEKSVTWLLQHLDEVPEAIRTAVRNNGGGHLDHTMYWKCMSPGAGAEPAGRLAEAIAASFGSFAAFKEQFSKTAATFFGSGWIWLCADSDGKLSVATTPGHDNPLYQGLDPLLVLDVWEHAYYLKYENRRAEFIAAWWNLVDWDYVAHNYLGAQFDAGLYKAAEWVGGTWAKLEAEWKKLTGA